MTMTEKILARASEKPQLSPGESSLRLMGFLMGFSEKPQRRLVFFYGFSKHRLGNYHEEGI